MGDCDIGIIFDKTMRQVRGKAFLLTYSQAPELSHAIIARSLPTTVLTPIEGMAIGQESHSDGGVHFHVMIILKTCIQKAASAFDLLGYHADIRIANARVGTYQQSLVNMWNYAIKEDPNPYIEGVAPKPPTKDSKKRKREETFTDALKIAKTESVANAMEHLLANEPFETMRAFDSLERALVTIRARSMTIQSTARSSDDFPNAPSVPDDWRVLFIHGKTGMGKTQWAKSLLPEATVVRHTDQLRTVDFSKGVIFDDFGVSHWPPAALIHLLDWDEPSGINIKHGHVVIPPHTRKIFTFNDPFHAWIPQGTSDDQLAALRRRVHVVDVQSSLY